MDVDRRIPAHRDGTLRQGVAACYASVELCDGVDAPQLGLRRVRLA